MEFASHMPVKNHLERLDVYIIIWYISVTY